MRRLFDEDGGEFELRMETELPADHVMHRLLRDGPLKAFLAGEGALRAWQTSKTSRLEPR